MHIVHSAIPAFRKALKGVYLKRVLAPPTWGCHSFLLIRIIFTHILPLAYRPEKTQNESDRCLHLGVDVTHDLEVVAKVWAAVRDE
jgi:hypothetical protein